MADTASEILRGVELSPDLAAAEDSVSYDERWGFLTAEEGLVARDVGQQTLLGFGVSGWQKGENTVEDRFEAITDVFHLEFGTFTIDRQGKGIGARMYNTPQALAATDERPSLVGMYAFNVNPWMIYDRRHPRDARLSGKAARVLSHRWQEFGARLFGTVGAIHIIDSKFGEAEAVLYHQTPAGERQKRRDKAPASPVPEELMVVRRPGAEFVKVGEYS